MANIKDLKDLLDSEKQVLSQDISFMIQDFYKKTGFTVSDINLNHQQDGSGGTILTKITIEVKS